MLLIVERVINRAAARRPPGAPHLDLLVYLRHAFLRVDVEDERSQRLDVAVVD